MAHDKLLFTPGPLTTSLSVKQAMLHDAGSWHYEFRETVRMVREQLLSVAGVSRQNGYESILMQGSGSFGVEAVFSTCVPRDGKVVVLANGAYGERMAQMLQVAGIGHLVLRTPENVPNDPADLDQLLIDDPSVTHVAAVHCETTTGILNPVAELGRLTRKHRRSFVVDAMSSFGAVPIDMVEAGVDFLVSSPNKCLEGVPGFSFIIARREALLACQGFARSLSLDLLSQWKGFEKNGQFRFTPPTHAILALARALSELGQEGGVAVRAARYRRNHAVLVAGMCDLGFETYLEPELQSHIITSFHCPDDPGFTFEEFYRGLSDRGFIIYPGKISQANLFRIGTIGRLFEADIRALIGGVKETLRDMQLDVADAFV
ncbi:MAG: 2-aminoethylphosphonate--pyruvate transaminase [Verrucomicrobia bacterium]|nr:2-aminoethylphosphonate--pyruvate transaminase [Verrucomicrobiota bacterium]